MKIVLAESEGFSGTALENLRRCGAVEMPAFDRKALLSALRDADALWVRLGHRIDAELLSAAPRLRIIVSPTTGLNHIDLDEAGRRGIEILSLRGEVEFLQDVRATAEHTIGLVLALLRRIPSASSHARGGGWNRNLFKGREIYGKTAGVVGYGRLGKIVARYLHAFGARVLAADPAAGTGSAEPGVSLVPLPTLLGEADLVTLHVNLMHDTQGFFGLEQFRAMRRGAWFVNTARGELIDEDALLAALASGHLAGAALDVLWNESDGALEGNRLVAYARDHDNLIITPHVGGCTWESMEKTEIFLSRRLGEVLGCAAQPVAKPE